MVGDSQAQTTGRERQRELRTNLAEQHHSPYGYDIVFNDHDSN